MKILFVADGRSPIAQNWIRYFSQRGDEVYLASTFACEVDFPLQQLEFTPVAFSAAKKQGARPGSASGRSSGLVTAARQWLGPLTISRSANRLRTFIQEVKPDLVHALRVPYEGMLAADAYTGTPLVISIWGNDFTLHAPSTPLMKHYTRWAMSVADALHADCQRDIRLAREWGLGANRPTLVTPGNGGIRSDVFHPPASPVQEPVMINPRGFRAYVNNEAYFKAIPLVLQKIPGARFIFSSMEGKAQALEWIAALGIGHAVTLMPQLSHEQMAGVFRSAQLVVSPAIHDGTPNTLLEGIACGCFPVAGDLESIREWITHGENGLLVNPNDPRSIAEGILNALQKEDLRSKAAGLNANMISARAEYGMNMKKVETFYERVARR